MYLVRNDQNKTVESIKMMLHQWASIWLPEASFGLRVLSLPASVRVSARPSGRPSPILSAQ